MQIELRRFKAYHARSEETLNFTADIYVDGKRAGTVDNDGRGGCCSIYFLDFATGERVQKHVEALPPEPNPSGGPPLKMDMDFFFMLLAGKAVTKAEEAKAQRRRARYAMDARVRGLYPFAGLYTALNGATYEVFLALKVNDEGAARREVEKMAARRKGSNVEVTRLFVV